MNPSRPDANIAVRALIVNRMHPVFSTSGGTTSARSGSQAEAARARAETRGVHIRTDFPQPDEGFAVRSFDQRTVR